MKKRYDPDDRLTSLYDKAVRQTMTQIKDAASTLDDPRLTLAQMFETLLAGPAPIRFTAYDGSAYGPRGRRVGLDLKNERGLAYLVTAPGDLGLARAYVSGDLDVLGVHPGRPLRGMVMLLRAMRFRRPSPAEALDAAALDRADASWCRRRRRRRSTCRAGAG